MKTSEVIYQLQRLVEKYGDKEFHIYKSFSKETGTPGEPIFDEGEDDIYMGLYA
jgi:hypothetical protein